MTQTPTLVRPAAQLAPPVVLDRAFDDPDLVRSLIATGAPYKSIAAVQKEPVGTRPAPWFRNFWALGGKVLLPGAQPVFDNPNFIAAARQAVDAQVIMPLAMMTNFNPPAPAAPPHLDLPFFRGVHQRELPLWLLSPMGYSGLFHRWAIPVASAITWLYEGEGGEFEYWPDGLAAPSRCQGQLAGNGAVVADNEYMYHRVRQIGRESQFLPGNRIDYDAMLALHDDRWTIERQGRVLAGFDYGQMRISILWKAFCFVDRQQADAYLAGEDRLTPAQVVAIFQDDLARRGKAVDVPADLDGHSAWADLVRATYPPQTLAG